MLRGERQRKIVKYRVEYSNDARKSLKSMSRETSDLILNKIDGLAENPFTPNPNIKRLVGRPEFRLRVGDWCILYAIHHDALYIEILKIGSRGGF